MVHSCLAPYEFKQVGVTAGLNVPIRVAWLRPLFPRDDTPHQRDFARDGTYSTLSLKHAFTASFVRVPPCFSCRKASERCQQSANHTEIDLRIHTFPL
ncbi:hypothetical protein Y032_0346g3145 [Ancylostoma ceylanicum]|uniref:Uncharacterized protein n=1 Tax=Ancylostoma ceylanicum TaxID=53326 RepID=A0A016RY10_9BILA|nr:hypothetical protein Y032_0346g3145 [Ancylostoma ceylanicum]